MENPSDPTNLHAVYEQICEVAPILFFSVDTDYRYTYINPFLSMIHEVDQQQAVGMHISEVIGPETFENLKPKYDRVLNGESIDYESFFMTTHGKPHHYRAIYKPLEVNNKIVGLFIFN